MFSGQPVSKFGWRSFFFFFIVVANVHPSIINSFYRYQIQLSPKGEILSPIVLIVFKKNGPIRIQYLSACQEGSDGSFSLL